MKGLLKLLGSECWGSHDWIYKSNNRGLWLECRRCGHESPGLELPVPRYRRTQEGIEDVHRLDTARPPQAPTPAWGFVERRAGWRAAAAARATSRDIAAPRGAAAPATSPGLSGDEQRWLDQWRSLSPDARAVAERMMTSLGERDAALRARETAHHVAHAS